MFLFLRITVALDYCNLHQSLKAAQRSTFFLRQLFFCLKEGDKIDFLLITLCYFLLSCSVDKTSNRLSIPGHDTMCEANAGSRDIFTHAYGYNFPRTGSLKWTEREAALEPGTQAKHTYCTFKQMQRTLTKRWQKVVELVAKQYRSSSI